MCGQRLALEYEKDEEEERKEEEQKKEECVFHQVHLELHSTGDILREIHQVTMGQFSQNTDPTNVTHCQVLYGVRVRQ